MFAWFSAGALGALLLAGCSKEAGREATEVLEQTYQIEPNARLTIHNLSGSIFVRGAETTELKLQATKKAASVAQLKDINIRVAANSDSVSIATSVLPQKKRSLSGTGTVDYVLVVPRTMKIARLDLDDGAVLIEGMEGEDVRANVVDGQLTVRNCCGDIHVAIAKGDLDLSYQDCAQHSFRTDVQVIDGDARVSIPRAASFHVRAQTATGRITNDFVDMVQVNSRLLQKIDMSVGSNARSELAVRVTTGDIAIAAVDPTPSQQAASTVSSE